MTTWAASLTPATTNGTPTRRWDYFLAPRTVTLAYQRTEQDDVKRTHRTIYGLTWEGLTRGTDRQHL